MDPNDIWHFVRKIASAYSTPLPAVLDMPWLDIIVHAYAAYFDEYQDKLFQIKLAGVKLRG